jgi:magnesium transporter
MRIASASRPTCGSTGSERLSNDNSDAVKDAQNGARRKQSKAELQTRQLVVCRGDGRFDSTINPKDISEILHKKGEFVWLDLQDPQEQDIALLHDEFHFHALAIEDATRHHERPKIDAYEGYYFIVFYAVNYDQAAECLLVEAINLFVGENYLVSVHNGSIPAIDNTIKRWQANNEQFGNDAGALLYELFDAIVDDYFPVIDQLAERVEVIEEQIFERFQEEALQEVFGLKRDLLHVRRVVAPERDVLNILIRREVPIFERGTILYLQDVYDHIVRITDSIDTYRELLSSALDAFLSVQSNRLNQIVAEVFDKFRWMVHAILTHILGKVEGRRLMRCPLMNTAQLVLRRNTVPLLVQAHPRICGIQEVHRSLAFLKPSMKNCTTMWISPTCGIHSGKKGMPKK